MMQHVEDPRGNVLKHKKNLQKCWENMASFYILHYTTHPLCLNLQICADVLTAGKERTTWSESSQFSSNLGPGSACTFT